MLMEIQRTIGADIIMAFDECTPHPCDYNYAKRSMKMTHRWLIVASITWILYRLNTGTSKLFFPLYRVPIKIYAQSAEYIANSNQQGNAIGGLSVGEPAEEMYADEVVCEILPEDKPRYLMGVGTPINILENIALVLICLIV
jgi:queuine tRNA-ribosyltransferase